MKYQRTQIYLEPEDHRKLRDEARTRGISLAALLREIASAHVSERAPAYKTKSWEGIIGLAKGGPPSDIVRFEHEYKREWADAQIRKLEQQAKEQQRKPRKPAKS